MGMGYGEDGGGFFFWWGASTSCEAFGVDEGVEILDLLFEILDTLVGEV